MDKTFYKVITTMQEIALSGVNECSYGDPWEIESVARKYPLIWLDPHLKSHTWQNGVLKLRIDIYVVDVVKGDESNELDVVSDMTNIGVQYVNYLTEHISEYGFYIRKNKNNIIPFQSFTEKFDDSVAGVKFETVIDIPDDGNICINIFE